MAFHNANFQMYPLPVGTYNTGQLGNGITASTVHQIYCVSAGTISVIALGGGSATFPMTAGQSINVVVGACTVSSGMFVGFKAKNNNSAIGAIQWPA